MAARRYEVAKGAPYTEEDGRGRERLELREAEGNGGEEDETEWGERREQSQQ